MSNRNRDERGYEDTSRGERSRYQASGATGWEQEHAEREQGSEAGGYGRGDRDVQGRYSTGDQLRRGASRGNAHAKSGYQDRSYQERSYQERLHGTRGQEDDYESTRESGTGQRGYGSSHRGWDEYASQGRSQMGYGSSGHEHTPGGWPSQSEAGGRQGHGSSGYSDYSRESAYGREGYGGRGMTGQGSQAYERGGLSGTSQGYWSQEEQGYGTRQVQGTSGYGAQQYDQWGTPSGQRSGYRGLGPQNYTRSDERIREDLNERLTDADDVDASGITVEVSNGVATLNGSVDQRWMKHRAEDIVESCSGVRDVRNQIQVGGSRESTRRSSNDSMTGSSGSLSGSSSTLSGSSGNLSSGTSGTSTGSRGSSQGTSG